MQSARRRSESLFDQSNRQFLYFLKFIQFHLKKKRIKQKDDDEDDRGASALTKKIELLKKNKNKQVYTFVGSPSTVVEAPGSSALASARVA